MKNLSLLLTLSLVSLMGACNVVNSGTPNSQENSAVDSSVTFESIEETSAEGINIEEPNLEAQAEEIPAVDGSMKEAPSLGAEIAPEEQYTTDEAVNPVLPGDETVEIPSDAPSAVVDDAQILVDDGSMTEEPSLGAEVAPEEQYTTDEAVNPILPAEETLEIPSDAPSAVVDDAQIPAAVDPAK